jgi:hypothetical protein
MRKEVKRRQEELLSYHRAQGVIDVRKLTAGTRIVIETPTENYELEVGTPERGVVLIASDKRFTKRDKAVVSGSYDPNTRIFLPKIIGYGLKIVLRRPYKLAIRTGPVVAAKVIGKGDSYEYRLWEDCLK